MEINGSLVNYVMASMEAQRQRDEADMYELKGLEWTTTPPAVEGWYWVKTKYSFVGVVRFSKMENSPIGYYDIPGMSGMQGMEDFTHWLGPLPEPEPPQG